MILSKANGGNVRKTVSASVLVLSALAATLSTPQLTDAATMQQSITKAASKRLSTKPVTEAVAKRSPTAIRNRAALQRQLRELDVQALSRIEMRYGTYIDPGRMARAKASQTRFLSHPGYQQQLKQTYPNLQKQERQYVVGNYVRGKTYVDRNQVQVPRTVAHERIHQLADPRFRVQAGSRLDEGMTEFFASKVYADLKIRNASVAYPQQQKVVEMMASRVSERNLANAYFGGNVSHLQKQLDAQLGTGAFRRIARAMERGRHEEAIKILRYSR